MNKPIVAICYDFDNTLSPKCMQEYGFISKLDISPTEFWEKSDEYIKKYNADSVTSYMYNMLKTYKEKNLVFTKKDLHDCGKQIDLYDGVDTWFKRINEFGKQNGVIVEHYIISTGNKEILEGTKIAKEFTEIYASSYMWNEKDEPIWPAMAINYTNKTQFLYRINKGISSVTDNTVNNKMPNEKKRIPLSNFIYIGDSSTDVPCMRLVVKHTGYAIGIYDPNSNHLDAIFELNDNNRIPYFVPANYNENSPMDILIKEIILKIKSESNLDQMSKKQKETINELKQQKTCK